MEKKTKSLLPVRDERGWKKPKVEEEPDISSQGDASSEMGTAFVGELKNGTVKSSRLSREQEANACFEKMSLEEKRIHIGALACVVTEDPSSHMKTNITKLLNYLLLEKKKLDLIQNVALREIECESTIKVVLVSLLAVFQDILPEYSIRQLSDSECQVKVHPK